MRSRGPAAGALALLLAACSVGRAGQADEGKIYPRPAADVRSALLGTGLPFPLQGTRLSTVQTRPMADGSIEIALADDAGKPQLRFLAMVNDVGTAKTRVALTYAGADAALEKGVAAHPEIEAVYLKTMREQVDSELEGRPFNNLAIGPEIMTAFAANVGTIRKQMDQAAEESYKRDRQNIDNAYAAEARGQW